MEIQHKFLDFQAIARTLYTKKAIHLYLNLSKQKQLRNHLNCLLLQGNICCQNYDH